MEFPFDQAALKIRFAVCAVIITLAGSAAGQSLDTAAPLTLLSGAQKILDAYPWVRWVGPCTGADKSANWAFYDCHDPKESDHIYIEVPEGCSPEAFKLADRIARGSTFMWEELWHSKNGGYHSTIRLWEVGLQLPAQAQRQLAHEVNETTFKGRVMVRAIGTFTPKSGTGTEWILDCRSLVPHLPDLYIEIPAGGDATAISFEVIRS